MNVDGFDIDIFLGFKSASICIYPVKRNAIEALAFELNIYTKQT